MEGLGVGECSPLERFGNIEWDPLQISVTSIFQVIRVGKR